MSQHRLDIEKVVKDWADVQYDQTADRKQRRLRAKELKNRGKYLGVRVDWSDVRFFDDTRWLRLAEDKFNDSLDSGTEVTPPKKSITERADTGYSHSNILFRTQFTNNTKDDQEYTMHVEKTTCSICTTEIENTFTKGIDISVKLAAPGEVFEANAGYSRELSLTNIEGETIEEQLTWGAESQIKVKAEHIAEAQLVVDEKKFAGDFEIHTRIRGQVYVEFLDRRHNNEFVKGITHDFHEIIREFKDTERRKGQSVDDFVSIQGDAVTIITKGKCNFRYGVKQEVRVDQKPLNQL